MTFLPFALCHDSLCRLLHEICQHTLGKVTLIGTVKINAAGLGIRTASLIGRPLFNCRLVAAYVHVLSIREGIAKLGEQRLHGIHCLSGLGDDVIRAKDLGVSLAELRAMSGHVDLGDQRNTALGCIRV